MRKAYKERVDHFRKPYPSDYRTDEEILEDILVVEKDKRYQTVLVNWVVANGLLTEEELKKGRMIKRAVEEAKKEILASKWFSKIKKIILFGSAAENKLSYRSDIDLAVVFSEISPKESSEFRVKIMGLLNEKRDIQVYNNLPEKIKKEIEKKGRTIWKKE